MEGMPIATLSNGIRVANFSSPHPFVFEDGTVLDACSAERARTLLLKSEEKITPDDIHGTPIELIDLKFEMSPVVREALYEASHLWDAWVVDIIIVPFPILPLVGEEAGVHGPFRTCRIVDRVAKLCSITKWCMHTPAQL